MILVSPSDIPIRSFPYVYSRLMRSSKSYVSFMGDTRGQPKVNTPCTAFIKLRKCKDLAGEYVVDRQCVPIAQWKILQRSDAKRFVAMTRDRRYVRMFTSACIHFQPSGQAPDEFMFPLWINYLYNKKGSRKSVATHFIDANTTYLEFKGRRVWSPTKKRFVVLDAPHPVQIHGIGRARKRIICGEGCMFMRKVDRATPGQLRAAKLPLTCRGKQ
jgi:hypothetical protein